MSIDLTNTSRGDVTMRKLSKATERMFNLEREALRTFEEYHEVREELLAMSVVVDVQLTPGMAAAFSAWKQELAAQAGRDMHREDLERVGAWKLPGE